jgi:amicoumacin kinase
MWRREAPFPAGAAEELAERWGGVIDDPVALGSWENFVYAAHRPEGRFVVRITEATRRSFTEVEAETSWVRALGESGVSVARPLISRTGRLVERLDGTASTFFAAAFQWLPGSGVSPLQWRGAGPTLWSRWAEAVARLHVTAQTLPPCAGPARRWDNDPLLESMYSGLPRHVADERDCVLEWIAGLDEPSGIFGVVHGDLHGRNVRLLRRSLHIFDFDDACRHWATYDLAVVLQWAFQTDGDPEYEGAFRSLVEGYAAVHPLTSVWFDRIPGLIRLRRLLDYVQLRDSLDMVVPSERGRLRARLHAVSDAMGRSWAPRGMTVLA